MKFYAFVFMAFAISILGSGYSDVGEQCLNTVHIGDVEYFGAFTEYTKENLIGNPQRKLISNEPTNTLKKYRTDIFVFTEDNSPKTVEEVEEDIIMDTAYHRNGTVWMSTSNGIYKYKQYDEIITFNSINDSVSPREIKQLTVLNDTLNIVLANDRVKFILHGQFLIDCPPKLLTGYHIAVDANCNVYYVKTYYHFKSVHEYITNAGRPDSVAPSFVVDYHHNKVFRSYSKGLYYHSPENVLNITEKNITYSDILDVGLDNQDNIFVLTKDEFFVLFPVQNASCIFENEAASMSLFPPPEKLDEFKQRTQVIINEDTCVKRSAIDGTTTTLLVTLISSVGLVVLVSIAAYKTIVTRCSSKPNTSRVEDDVNCEMNIGNDAHSNVVPSEYHDYTSIVYNNHYETIDADSIAAQYEI